MFLSMENAESFLIFPPPLLMYSLCNLYYDVKRLDKKLAGNIIGTHISIFY